MTQTPQPERQYASLAHALQAHQIPKENHTFIQRFCEEVRVTSVHERGTYIKAQRSDGGPALQINFGWTNGFRSEEEARRAAGDHAKYWPSRRGTGQWGVDHPVHKARLNPAKPKATRTDFGTCPVHFLRLPATGVCNDCED